MKFFKLLFGIIVSVMVVQVIVLLVGSKGDPVALGALPMTMLFFGFLAIFFALLAIGLIGLILRWTKKLQFLPATLIVLGGVMVVLNFRRAESLGEDMRVVSAIAWVNCGFALLLWGSLALASRLVRSRI